MRLFLLILTVNPFMWNTIGTESSNSSYDYCFFYFKPLNLPLFVY